MRFKHIRGLLLDKISVECEAISKVAKRKDCGILNSIQKK
jgi:hypothetical protein